MSIDDVDWERLPHDAIGFFGLTEGFDRKDLKRSYGRLIRVYRPETHPAEFQRIRNAYEMLESELRYGKEKNLQTARLTAWESTSRVSVSGGSDHAAAGAESSQPRSTSLNVEDDPLGLYKHLASNTTKTPQDYFALAILSDVLDKSDPQRFLKWLLTGLKQYPDDPGLLRFLREHLSTDVDANSAQSILLTLSKIIPGSSFYPVSEPLWARIFRELPFEKYSKLFEACESNLKQLSSLHQLIFYIQTLKQTLWTAPWEWNQSKWKLIQSRGSEIPSGHDQDIELLGWLMEYMQIDRKKIGSNPTRKMIDDMLRSYCVDPWLIAAGKIAQVQDEIARSSIGFMDTFASAQSEADHRVLLLTQMVAWDALEQSGLHLSDQKNDAITKNAALTVADLRTDSEEVGNRIFWMEKRMTWLPWLMLAAFPPLFAWGWVDTGTIVLGGLVWIALVSGLYFGVISPFILKPWITKKVQRICRDSYESLWRPRIFRFVQGCRVTPNVAMESLRESAFHSGSGQLIDVILSYGINDLGLRTFHLAQCFVH